MTLPLIARAYEHATNTAIVTPEAAFTYEDLLAQSGRIATALGSSAPDLQEARVAFLIPSGFEYVATQWGIWRAGGIAVPLCVSHPRPELEYVITQSGASILIAHPQFADLLRPIAADHQLPLRLTTDPLPPVGPLPDIDPGRRALILYTSGTTGKPKGVVTTHNNIQAQVTSLVEAWEWTACDRILHVLPLHHIHGIVNVLTCALWVGAECHMLPKFDAERVWQYFSQGDLTLFMAVPTIYVKLIAAWEAANSQTDSHANPPLPVENSGAEDHSISLPSASSARSAELAGLAKIRLMVSGSAALPVRVLQQWQQISGHLLLERYGMTEIGMALSNPLHGERLPGCVGQPLPQVEVRLVDESGQIVPAGTPGEIQVRGPGVFLEYWQNPSATEKAFQNGWFQTGDFAIAENGSYRILGRLSVDIIKTGGYKVSALEIEEVLRTHPDIQDCAVVGVPDPEWGERVCAALVCAPARELSLTPFRDWAKMQLAVYKVPAQILALEALPRNAMGKVTKPAIVKLFQGNEPGNEAGN